MKQKILSILLSISMCLSLLSLSASAENPATFGTNVTAEALDHMTVTPTEIDSAGTVTVRIDFSGNHTDKNCRLHGGDFMTVTWTNTAPVYLEGFQADLDLMQDGVKIAVAHIEQKEARITFLDVVDSLENVYGHVVFTLKGLNLTQTTDTEHIGKAEIFCGNESASVNIKTYPAGEAEFFGKSGGMYPDDTDHVYWWLIINEPKLPLWRDCVVTDQIQAGQAFADVESFKVTTPDGRETYYYDDDYNGTNDFFDAYPNAKLEVDGNRFTLTLPRDDLSETAIQMAYTTRITNTKTPVFVNKADAEYGYVENGKNSEVMHDSTER